MMFFIFLYLIIGACVIFFHTISKEENRTRFKNHDILTKIIVVIILAVISVLWLPLYICDLFLRLGKR